MNDEYWMHLALAQARDAAAAGEVPVGAVVVKQGALVATGRNDPVARNDPSAHAEMNALRAAATALGNYRLEGCEIFVTLEPCAMCAGAMLHARVARVVFGAADPKTGAAGSVVDLFSDARLNHRTIVQSGVLAPACAGLLQDFFRARREAAHARAIPLRDDALRTPAACFDGLPDYSWTPRYVSDLPALKGWRLHYIDAGPDKAPLACICLHGAGQWSYLYRHFVRALEKNGGVRILAPDLIGFGMSDKPKRETVHRLDWHARVLAEWIEWLGLRRVLLVRTADAGALQALADELALRVPERIAGIQTVTTVESEDRPDVVWRAPFPDRGFEAALRVWGKPAAATDISTADIGSGILGLRACL